MRTYGHGEGNIRHWGLLREWEAKRKDSSGWENWGGITVGEIPNVDDGEMDAANHQGTCMPM